MVKPVDPKDPEDYIGQITDEARRADVVALDAMIREVAPDLDRHLRSGLLGYGSLRYRYASGREGEWFLIGLGSQKRYVSLYVCAIEDGEYLAERYRERLPAADIGRSCVRFKRLADVDEGVLRELVGDAARLYAADPDGAFAQ